MAGYLESLTVRLALATAELPEETRQRHRRFLENAQRPDGGFAGREGASDLYYTAFGLRGLAILGQLEGAAAERAGSFLQQRLRGQESIIDLFSLIYAAKLLEAATGHDVFAQEDPGWPQSFAKAMEQLRCSDGGYAKGPGGRAGSTYHTFLVLLCLQLLELPIAEPDRILAFIHSQAAAEGGFREIRVSKRAGTNPTAAAIAVLRILDQLDEATIETTVDFLVDMQTDDGGLRANTRIPIPDILSTFTGLVTLVDLDRVKELDLTDVAHFAHRLENEQGGFYGAEWDVACDVEYTFYGLGSLALLQSVRE